MGAREEGEWSEKEEQEEAREDSENGARLKRDCGEISTRLKQEPAKHTRGEKAEYEQCGEIFNGRHEGE